MTFPWALLIVGIIGSLAWVVTAYIAAMNCREDTPDAVGFEQPEPENEEEDDE